MTDLEFSKIRIEEGATDNLEYSVGRFIELEINLAPLMLHDAEAYHENKVLKKKFTFGDLLKVDKEDNSEHHVSLLFM
mgnify:CR=1 FL=1